MAGRGRGRGRGRRGRARGRNRSRSRGGYSRVSSPARSRSRNRDSRPPSRSASRSRSRSRDSLSSRARRAAGETVGSGGTGFYHVIPDRDRKDVVCASRWITVDNKTTDTVVWLMPAEEDVVKHVVKRGFELRAITLEIQPFITGSTFGKFSCIVIPNDKVPKKGSETDKASFISENKESVYWMYDRVPRDYTWNLAPGGKLMFEISGTTSVWPAVAVASQTYGTTLASEAVVYKVRGLWLCSVVE